MHYYEKTTGKVGGCDYGALRSAIDIHGEKKGIQKIIWR